MVVTEAGLEYEIFLDSGWRVLDCWVAGFNLFVFVGIKRCELRRRRALLQEQSLLIRVASCCLK